MSATAEKFTLRPQEKRLLAGIGIVLFIVFNVWFVWPTFKEWGVVQRKIGEANDKIRIYKKEIGQLPALENNLKELRGQEDSAEIAKVDQTVEFRRKVETMAATGKIMVSTMTGPNRSVNVTTNQFFEEWNLSMQIVSGEKDLVEFLYKLSSGNSTIRVRDLRLSQGPNFTNLSANVVLVANYQKSATNAPAARKP